MPAKKIAIPAQKVAEGRFLYEQTLTPIDDIAALMRISRSTLQSRIREFGWQPRVSNPHARGFQRVRQQAAPGEARGPARGYPPGFEERLALVKQMQAIVKRQVEAIDRMLPAKNPGEAEQSSRALAGLLRTLQEMMRLEAPPAPFETADDEPAYDLDELRRELSRKLAAIVAGRAGAVPSGV